MKNNWKRGLALMLAAGMFVGSTPVQAATNVRTKSDIIKEKLSKATKKSEEAAYAEGEAIVLYDTTSSTLKRLGAGTFDSDIEVVETYTFDQSKTAPSIKSNAGVVSDSSGIRVSLVKSDKYTTQELIQKLSGQSDVRAVEPNYRVKITGTTDPYRQYQWALENIGQNGGTEGEDINPDQAALNKDGNEEEKVIAIVDSGIDYTNPELQNVVWNNPINSNQLKGEHGYDFYNYDEDPLDENGHGTHCCGIMAAASKNDEGISGVATSNNIKIMGLKFLDEDGYGYSFGAIGAYNYIYRAQQLGVNVVAINNSWGGEDDGESLILKELMDLVGEAGAISVCAAGNDSSDNDIIDTIPTNIDSEYNISVAASNEKGELADFSNYGKESVDIAAPGADILSTVSYDVFNPGIYTDAQRAKLCSFYEDFSEGKLTQVENFKEEGQKETTEAVGTTEAAGTTEVAEDVQTTETGKGTEATEVLQAQEADEKEIVYSINSGDATSELTLTKDVYFGTKENGSSLKWTIKDAEQDQLYYLNIPYDAVKSATPVHLNAMIQAEQPKELGDGEIAGFFGTSIIYVCESGITSDGEYDEDNETVISYATPGNYWEQLSDEVAGKVKKDEQRMISIQLLAASDGDYTIYLDDLGISAADVETSEFGKYAYYNGTSMATPHVTAAVAAVANAYPDMDALTRKATVLGYSNKKESMQDKLSAGGVLDLSMVENPRMSVVSITKNAENNIEIKGHYLKDAIVKVGDKVTEPIQQEDTLCVLNGENLLNKKITITVTKGEEVVEKECYFTSGQDLTAESGIDNGMYLQPAGTVSDGTYIYNISADGDVQSLNPEKLSEEDNIKDWMVSDNMGYGLYLFGEGYQNLVEYEIQSEIGVICSNKKLWTVLKLDAGFCEEKILVSFDSANGWEKVADIPEEIKNLSNMTIGAYNGSIYLMGGLDESAGTCSNLVMNYDSVEKVWNKAPSLPEGRAFAKALQVGSQLVVTLGCGDTEGYPANLIFDGTAWKTSGATVKSAGYETYIYMDKEGMPQSKQYTAAQIGIMKDGIIYAGNKADDLGEVYTYTITEDQYQSVGYAFMDTLGENEIFQAVSIGNKFYILTGYYEEYEDYFEDDFYYESNNVAAKDAENPTTEGNTEAPVVEENPLEWCMACLCPITIESGYIEVKDEGKEKINAWVEGAGLYLPGDTITLSPAVFEGYYVESFIVNGKKIEADKDGTYSYTCLAEESVSGMTAATQAGAYVQEIWMDYMLELAPGQDYTLVPSYMPETIENTKLKWESDNTAVATVDVNGKVTVSANAKPGDMATIRATALDRGTVSAECLVMVVEEDEANQPPEKNSKVKVGKLTYKVTKSAAKNGTVSCVAVNSKNLTKVTIPATVKINGYTFKVTAVEKNAFKGAKKLKSVVVGKNVTKIGKNAWKNCSGLKKVTIKGAKLKSIGKGAFSGIHKKAVIKVPKKQKKAYSKKLKNAGYKGTVK